MRLLILLRLGFRLGVSIKEIIFMIFFSGGSGVFIEVVVGGHFCFRLVGGSVINGVPPPRYI